MTESTRDTASSAERAELDALSVGLASRGSILHFAVALGASFVCVIAAGIGVKLGFDRAWSMSAAAGVLALAGLGVAARGFWKGQKLMAQEHSQFQRLLELRAKAGLD